MFIMKVRIQLPDGTITKLPLVWKLKHEKTGKFYREVAHWDTYDEAIEWLTYCLPGHPDIEEVPDDN
jgi:hypothetical protein